VKVYAYIFCCSISAEEARSDVKQNHLWPLLDRNGKIVVEHWDVLQMRQR
jgi:hypothetical protein